MYRFLPYLLAGILVWIVLLYVYRYYPDELDRAMLKVDVLEITSASQKEHERLDKIKRLTDIGILEKEVLINHNVFIGATAQMMEYAIGVPRHILKSKKSSKLLYYIYFLAGEKKPTFFELSCTDESAKKCKIECAFENTECRIEEENKAFFALDRAYRRSAIDLANPESPEGR